MSDAIEVWLDSDLMPLALVGTLTRGTKGIVRFQYAAEWLKNPLKFAIDPATILDKGPFYPDNGMANFGALLDSSPDRWGETLMQRRESLAALDEARAPRTLHAWDFLLGVQDLTRQGALRFRLPPAGEEAVQRPAVFLACDDLPAPLLSSLGELEDVARELTRKNITDLQRLRRWLAVLVAPGASLGGARPKANFTDVDDTLWIAKFPALDDTRDIGAWEKVTHDLALAAGVEVPEARLLTFNNEFRTFCVKRFDREPGQRRFYSSAMTLLRKNIETGNEASYLEIAEFIANNCDPAYRSTDLEQMFRRVVFNVAVGNRDDHLRNHGFLYTHAGWRLAKAFDVNPNIHKAEHVLRIDDQHHRASLALVKTTAAFYEVSDARADTIIEEVAAVLDTWRDVAMRYRISQADIDLTASAFSAHAEFRTPGAKPALPMAPRTRGTRSRARPGRPDDAAPHADAPEDDDSTAPLRPRGG